MPRHIHFIGDVTEKDTEYKCLKCGHTTFTTAQMYRHRKGFLSECLGKRISQYIGSIYSGVKS